MVVELIGITLAISVGCNLLAGIASFLLLHTNLFQGGRIQGQTDGEISSQRLLFRRRFPLIGLNLSILVLLTVAGLTLGYDAFDFGWQGIPAVAAQFLLLVVIDDTWFYFLHRSLHRNAWLFRKIHRIHHRASAPFPLEYIYVHPLEWTLRAAAIPVGLGVIHVLNGSISTHAFWAFSFWMNIHEIAIHSGMRSVFGHLIPFFATTEIHDRHHLKARGNYASTFTIWDRLLKTADPPPSTTEESG